MERVILQSVGTEQKMCLTVFLTKIQKASEYVLEHQYKVG